MVRLIKTIKSNALDTWLLCLLCQEFDVDQEALLVHNEVQSSVTERGKFFKKLVDKVALETGMLEQHNFLLNSLNKSFQGRFTPVVGLPTKRERQRKGLRTKGSHMEHVMSLECRSHTKEYRSEMWR